MDAEILYALLGIFGFVLVIMWILFSSKPSSSIKTQAIKKSEIIFEYTQKLEKALKECKDNKELRIETKKVCMKEYSNELARNIFFDADEVREILQELSKM